jgi:hypothetical protein
MTKGWTGFDFRQGKQIFLYSAASRPAFIQWVPRALSEGVKWPGREADHSPPSSDEVKNDGSITPPPHTSSWHGVT